VADIKTCKKCNEQKELTEFRKVNSNKDGLDTRCKECRKQEYKENPAQKEYYYRHHETLLQREAKKRKNKDHKEYHVQYTRKDRIENKEKVSLRSSKYRENNKEYYNDYQKKRRVLRNSLDDMYPEYIESQVYDCFGDKCYLTNTEDNVILDHFIPIGWGHGGTYHGNLYPLNVNINSTKSGNNPFEIIEFINEKYQIDIHKWNKLIETLATLNGVTVDEFKEFVYWCEANKRTVDDIQANPVPSIELWKSTTL
jgi:hypothetical protein